MGHFCPNKIFDFVKICPNFVPRSAPSTSKFVRTLEPSYRGRNQCTYRVQWPIFAGTTFPTTPICQHPKPKPITIVAHSPSPFSR
ncbi:hypothetical protein M378DRAFT_905998 [Amanita muscaria Koide BX008]|uniref:Uncharacterized protein n=1 Tax=Amanita muscaria (strain Koide BX008) TaxID=946122 RepID=A0A0C2VZ50_AMAMK|nr:hypothetical protein M378DRAFT_905998 [Amanita muscaria Koide BX008]